MVLELERNHNNATSSQEKFISETQTAKETVVTDPHFLVTENEDAKSLYTHYLTKY